MIDVIDGKWKPIIIDALKKNKLGFGELRRQVPEASKKVLIAQMRDLESAGIICRRSTQVGWERVEYSLTPYGRTLTPVLESMAKWGRKHRRLRAVTSGERRADTSSTRRIASA